MRVLICGGRDFTDMARVESALSRFSSLHGSPSLVIHGAARGADSLGALWATRNKIPTRAFPANWSLHGKMAGFIRNRLMITEGKPDHVIAFPGGTGTAHMVRISREAGLPVFQA